MALSILSDTPKLDVVRGLPEVRPSLRTPRLVVAGAAVVLAVPYALLGPKLVLDDWWVLRNQRFGGAFAGAGHFQALARPGAWLIFNILFGVVGPHPALLFAIQVGLIVLVAELLFGLLVYVMPWRWALAVTVTWQALPDHAAINHWASTANIVIALALVLAGGLILARFTNSPWVVVAAALACAAGSLCYEAVIPIAAAVMIGVPLLLGRRPQIWAVICPWGLLAATGTWMILHTSRHVPHGWAEASPVYVANFGAGLTTSTDTGRIVGFVAGIGLVFVLARFILSDFRPNTGLAERLVIAGMGVVVLGALPFAKFPVSVWGINDRAYAITSIGAALFWTGLIGLLIRYRVLLAGATASFALLVLPARVQRDRDWSAAGKDATHLLSEMRVDFVPGRVPIVIGPSARNRNGVVALVADWDTTAAYQLVTGDRSVSARITSSATDFSTALASPRLDLRSGQVLPPASPRVATRP